MAETIGYIIILLVLACLVWGFIKVNFAREKKVIEINDLRDSLGMSRNQTFLWGFFVIFTVMGGFVITAIFFEKVLAFIFE